ncbi:MAG TPA: hypothetical protein VMS00_04925 [Acidimicrobiales bacterium]|nr:hypothetical protein [Acidimicrobiales bacterium]
MSLDVPFGEAELPLAGDRPGPASLLLSSEIYYTDEELIKAQRSRLIEFERRARELEAHVLTAQARLGALVVRARVRSGEVEKEQVAGLVPWAEEESIAIVQDARQRAMELSLGTEAQPDLEDLGRLLLSHFELQEQLVHLLREAALAAGPSNPL